MTARKVAGWIFNVEIVVLVVLLCATLLPGLFGIKVFAVKSGSMEPTVPTGSLAYVQTKIDGADVAAGDVIAFGIESGAVVMHRAIENDTQAHHFITKGDANDLVDGNPVPYENLVGTLALHVPEAGYLFMRFEENKIAWIIGIVAANLVLAAVAAVLDRFIGREGKQ